MSDARTRVKQYVDAYKQQHAKLPTQKEVRQNVGQSRAISQAYSQLRREPEYAKHDTQKLTPQKYFINNNTPQTIQKRDVILSDIHIPYDDITLIQKILAWITTQHLNSIILNGDTLDCGKIGKFATADDYPLEDEIQRGRVFLDQLQEAATTQNKNCKIHWIDGNHENRILHYLQKDAERISGLKDINGDGVISIPSLLNLRQRGITYRTYKQTLKLTDDLYVEHGDRVSKHSGYTAKNLITDKGGSIIVGHVHRVGAHYKQDRNGLHRGYESGCLCTLSPDYVTEESANWQQGFIVVDHYEGGRWWVNQVLVQDGDFVIDGVLY